MKNLTPDMIREELMSCIGDLCIWEIPEGDQARTLFFIQGAYDMAHALIKRMEAEK